MSPVIHIAFCMCREASVPVEAAVRAPLPVVNQRLVGDFVPEPARARRRYEGPRVHGGCLVPATFPFPPGGQVHLWLVSMPQGGMGPEESGPTAASPDALPS